MVDRKVVTEIIDLYRDSPCLWDCNAENYKDYQQKAAAWKILVEKYKEIEPDANVTSMKKKIEHLKSAYKREAKKVQNSIRAGSVGIEVHRPNLWYYELMTFLDKQQPSVTDIISSDDDTQESIKSSSKSNQSQRKKPRLSDRKEHKLIDTAQEILKQKNNSFGLYVGEQLEMIPTSATHQRHIAEKLISEVIFLAKTDRLNVDSRIDTPTCSNCLKYNKN